MRFLCAFVVLTLSSAPMIFGGDLPTIKQPLPDVSIASGEAVSSVDLRNYFEVADIQGPVVQLRTTFGTINLEVFTNTVPATVSNFMNYVKSGRYTSNIVHRSDVDVHIIQGGGYNLPTLDHIATDAAIDLEYSLPNTRGTIAMARSTALNSATSEWFINTADNSYTLGPVNNGGYAVFGRVTGTGMNIVDTIAALPVWTFLSPFNQLPLTNYSGSGIVPNPCFVTINAAESVPVFPAQAGQAAVVSFSVSNSNPTLVAATVNGSSLLLAPFAGQSGNADLAVTATDSNGNGVTDSFRITVTATCYIAISSTSAGFSYSGGSGSFAVITGAGCAWSASSSVAWLHASSATNGSGTVNYTVDANPAASPRTGTISVGDKTFTVTQSGVPPVITQHPASQSALAGATIYMTLGATGPGLAWVWQKDGVTVPDGGHCTGVYTPTLAIHDVTAADAGNYSVWVGNAAAWIKSSNATLTVCSYSLASTSTNFTSGGGSGAIGVVAQAGCSWTASANVSWLHTTSSGAGNGTATFTVDSNASVTARSGTITVQGQTFTVNQAGVVCGFTLSPTSARFGTNGGVGAVTINNPCGGSWTATNNGAAWVTIISGSSGASTPGTVNYEVAPNYTGKSRSAYLTIGGESFGVFQGPFKNKGDLDFDGDGKADITVYDPAPGDWYVLYSKGGSTAFRWGGGSMVPVHGDFDGDGKSDRAIYYPDTGQWYLTLSGGGMKAVRWGNSSALPMPADYDGDGKTDCCVWETNAGDWYIPYSSGGSTTIRWGWKGTVPLTGDFDGDGKADIVNYDPKPGDWYLRCANGSMSKFNWGGGAMVPMVGDFNGDGKADAAVYYAAEGVFYIRYSGGGMGSIKWAGGSMKPVLADFDGDGKTDIAAYDAPGGAWYIRYATGVMKMVKWGWSEAVAP